MRHVVIVGANRGLGLALVRACLQRGDRVVAACREPRSAHELQALPGVTVVRLDVTEEASVEAAATKVRAHVGAVHLLVCVAGVLHTDEFGPERKIEHLDPEAIGRVFAVNAMGPALVAKHFWRLLKHDEPAVIANLSARVGSIEDNRVGGWYSYRASKAAQNMLTKTLAIELGRRAKNIAVVAVHPGTVDTELSAPFQRGVQHEIFTPERAARQLLEVVDVSPEASGSFLAWDGQAIPW